ncbi:hypothetical protein HDV00_008534 [Rhizophlyctis rosea]|nr:hypothetical protein HDV00_008534 [Rhizophlyctis rosea]
MSSGSSDGVDEADGAEQTETAPEMVDGADDGHEMKVLDVQLMDEGVDDESISDVTNWEDVDVREEAAEGEFEVLNKLTFQLKHLEYHVEI